MNKNILLGVGAVVGIVVLMMFFNKNDNDQMSDTGTVVQDESVATMPEDMPEVPMYPGLTVREVDDTESETERNVTLTLATADSVTDVNNWYLEALNQDGWDITSNQNVGGYQLLRSERDNVTTFMQAAGGEETIVTQRVRIR